MRADHMTRTTTDVFSYMRVAPITDVIGIVHNFASMYVCAHTLKRHAHAR
jgi:hypothetical protein